MTVLSNHRLHSYKATIASHRRVLTPKKTPMKKTTSRRIIISISLTKKTSTINNKTTEVKPEVQEVKPVSFSIDGLNIYEDLYGGWNPQIYEALNQEYDLDNSADYEDDMTEAMNEEAWEHLDYLEWLMD